MRRVACVLVFAAAICASNAFFDFDFFKNFNTGIDRTHEQFHHQLRTGIVADLPGHFRTEDEGEEAEEDEFHHGFPGGFSSQLGGFFNMFNQGSSRGPWWKGAHVCVEREEIDESQQKKDVKVKEEEKPKEETEDSEEIGMIGSFEFQSCQQTATKYTCTTKLRGRGIKKTMVVKYACCHGYRRLNGRDCEQVDLKSMMETASDLGAKEFVQLITSSQLEEKLTTDNLTLFAPTDNALRDFVDQMQQENSLDLPAGPARRRRQASTSMRDIALSHMTQGVFDLSELQNDQVLESDASSNLRINVYPGLTTVNCARVTKRDNPAVNGMVHIVDRVLKPVTKSIAQLLEQDPKLATIRELLDTAGMLERLNEAGHVTLFAPTNKAFKRLSAATLARLTEGHSCLTKVLKHHLLPHTLCAAAVTTQATAYTDGGEGVALERGEDGELLLDGARVTTRDVVATNGVVHIIDTVLIPDQAKSFSEVLAANNLTEFAKLVEEAGLTEKLDSMENVTLFVPTNEAIRSSEKMKKLAAYKDELREVLLYHSVQPETQSCDLANNMLLKTNMEDQRSVRVNLYASQPMFMGVRHRATVQCARIVGVDLGACSGVVHLVDRPVLPSAKNALELLEQPEFATFRKVVKASGLESLLEEKEAFTLLAPSEDAFEDLTVAELKKLTEDKDLAASVIKQHILPESLCCTGVTPTAWPFTNRAETMNGDSVQVRRDPNNNVHIGTALVTNCDLMATNGIVHTVNRVMVPQKNRRGGFKTKSFQRIGDPNVEVFLYGL